MGCVSILLIWCGRTGAGPPEPLKYATIEFEKNSSSPGGLFSPSGEMLTYCFGYGEATIANWDVKTKQQQKTVSKRDGGFGGMAYSPDGRTLAVKAGDRVCTIDVATGVRTNLYEHEGECIGFSQDGKRILSGGYDGRLRIWDVEKKAELSAIDTKGTPMCFALLPGTDYLVATVSSEPGAGTKLVAIDLKTAKVKVVIADDVRPSDSLAVSPDGKVFAVLMGSDKIVLKTCNTLETEATFKCPFHSMRCCFSETGRFLIVGGGGALVLFPTFDTFPGKVGIYDRESKKWVSRFDVGVDHVSSMSLAPKSNLLAVGTYRQKVLTVWDLSPVIGKASKK